MKEELEQKLMDKFKFMEARNVWSGEKLNFPMPCSCGEGWFQLIWNLCEKIETELMKLPKNSDYEFMVLQVKEKYGILCFYTGSIPSLIADAIFNAICEAEGRSTTICESCGAGGITKHRGNWIRTLCNQCGEELGYIDFNDKENCNEEF
ncbi:MAG: hypothetical protein PHE29_08230 [Tissierellia bacterium]|nr:hypothetical protein [Tissierellia bacterium]MDD4779052.1 hypothetical protein [Tissierellia bacterium]